MMDERTRYHTAWEVAKFLASSQVPDEVSLEVLLPRLTRPLRHKVESLLLDGINVGHLQGIIVKILSTGEPNA